MADLSVTENVEGSAGHKDGSFVRCTNDVKSSYVQNVTCVM